ncbi:MAG: hypothetical protein ABW223_08860 [Rariglobus sp.]
MFERLRETKTALVIRYKNWRRGMSEGQFATVRSLVIVVVLLGLGVGAYFTVGPAWRAWRYRQAMSQAIEYAERNDYRNTMLALKRATDLAPMDLATWRAVSDQLAELGSPQALVARENVVRLSPGDMSMRLAFVTEALRFGQVDMARSSLSEVDEAAQRDAAFHRLAAAVAMASGETAGLEEHLVALLATEPDDLLARFNLAAVRLWDVDPSRQQAAAEELEKLTAERTVRVRASLELLKQAARMRDSGRARVVVDLILDHMGVAPELRVSYDGSPAGWAALVQGLRETAEQTGAADVALVARWMGDVRLRAEALKWIDGLPPALREAPAVLKANTLLTAETEDLARLETLLRAGGLGPLPDDAVWLALASKVQRTRYQPARGRATWDDAITACDRSVAALSGLASLADVWRDAEGSERVLQEIIKVQPRLNWAYTALSNSYSARGDSMLLWQLYGTWANARPNDPAVVRTWLTLGAVMDRISPENARLAVKRAEDPAATPIDVALAAAAQWRRGALPSAVAWIDKLPSESRDRPEIAFWRAVVLADTKDRKLEATAVAGMARRPGLSAEETALINKAAR